jgi:hypothetical protein
VSVWQAYQNRFYPYSNAPMLKPILQPAEMIKNVSVAYPNANAMVFDAPEGKRFTIRGVRPREFARGLDGVQCFGCKWTLCGAVGKGTKGLWEHIMEAHLGIQRVEQPPQNGDSQNANQGVNGLSITSEPGSTVPAKTQVDNTELAKMEQEKNEDSSSDDKMQIDVPAPPPVPHNPSAPKDDKMQIDPPQSRIILTQIKPVPQICRWKNCGRDFTNESLSRFASHIRTHVPTEDLKIYSAPKQDL